MIIKYSNNFIFFSFFNDDTCYIRKLSARKNEQPEVYIRFNTSTLKFVILSSSISSLLIISQIISFDVTIYLLSILPVIISLGLYNL